MREEADRNLSSAKSKLEGKRAEIQKLKEEYALLQSNLKEFKNLEARGFFNDQGRVEAQKSFEKLRSVSGVLKAKYDIASGEIVEDTRASDAGYVVLKSPITVELDSLDDVDVYSFLKLIEEKFPGRVDVVSMYIKRKEAISPVLLRRIGTGEPVTVVTSKLEFVWRTMTSRESLNPDTSVDVTMETSEQPINPNPASAPVDPALAPVPSSQNAQTASPTSNSAGVKP